jgi:phosphatidate cytidylyltransferase
MKRIVPGLLIAGLWLLLLLFGSVHLFSFVIVVVVVIAADEYVRMVENRKLALWERCFLDLVIVLPVVAAALSCTPFLIAPVLIFGFALLTTYFLYRYRTLTDVYELLCKHFFGLFYIGFLGAHLSLLRFLPNGAEWLIVASVITASSDTGAYFTGKRFGKRKLCPNISPNKTVEGAVGGILSGVIGATLCASLLLPDVQLLFLLIASAFLVVIGIAGDLTESILKRGTGTKDSGTLLAGHGGILDRVDSLLFVAPVLYYLILSQVV